MAIPPDYLRPIWRRVMNSTGTGSLGLDPREADFVVSRGWARIDGERWRCSYEEAGLVEGDGRVTVRISRLPGSAEDSKRHWSIYGATAGHSRLTA